MIGPETQTKQTGTRLRCAPETIIHTCESPFLGPSSWPLIFRGWLSAGNGQSIIVQLPITLVLPSPKTF